MKLYKSFIKAAVVVVTGVMATACSDWLDYTPKDKQTYNQQFSTVVGFRNAVNGVYTAMYSSSLYGYSMSYGALDVMGNLYKISEKNQGFYELLTASYSSSNAAATLNSMWVSAYHNILNINVILKALDEYPEVLDVDDATIIKGELLALRAYLHLDMTRLFGPSYKHGDKGEGLAVPFAGEAKIIKRDRLTADQILTEHIIPDLDEAQRLLEGVDPILEGDVLDSGADADDENGNWMRYRNLRINYYAATLLKARAYIWMGDYTNALAEARKITDDKVVETAFPWVNPSRLLANNTNPDRIFSTECFYGYYRSDLGNIYKNTFAGSLDASNTLQPAIGKLSMLFKTSGDYRRQSQWTASTGLNSDYEFIKYKGFTPTDSDNPEFYATYVGLLRKSEAYLIASESAARLGEIGIAAAYLNEFRSARGESKIPPRVTAEDITKEIRYEYVREFRGEGQVFFNHKRNMEGFGLGDGIEMFQESPLDQSGLNISNLVSKPDGTVRYFPPIPASETY